MSKFELRSRTEELLDQPNITKRELFKNLQELDTINRLLGGHFATIWGLQQIMKDKHRTYTIIDYACGGGDTLRKIEKWANRNNFKVKLIGFDLLPDAIEFAQKNSLNSTIKYLVSDFSTFSTKGDIAICSLVCHHFYDEKLNSFINQMVNNSTLGVVINDLHRHPFAYYSISLLTRLFSKSYLVKNDAKLSVLKGFSMREWRNILNHLSFSNYTLKWIWAFRHVIIIENGIR